MTLHGEALTADFLPKQFHPHHHPMESHPEVAPSKLRKVGEWKDTLSAICPLRKKAVAFSYSAYPSSRMTLIVPKMTTHDSDAKRMSLGVSLSAEFSILEAFRHHVTSL